MLHLLNQSAKKFVSNSWGLVDFAIRLVNAFLNLPNRQVKCYGTLGSLSSDVFERRTSSGSEPFPLLISLDATVFILPSVLILTETICPKICSKSRLKSAKRPFPVDVHRSKTSLLKLPIEFTGEL